MIACRPAPHLAGTDGIRVLQIGINGAVCSADFQIGVMVLFDDLDAHLEVGATMRTSKTA